MFCIVGLGNPGLEYAKHRHNIGFMVADEIIRRYSISSTAEKKYSSEFFTCRHEENSFFVQKPTTYMNRSGVATAGLAGFYKIPPEKIIIIHDDLDLDPFKIKVKQAGSHGGHNGLKSLDAMIGKNTIRIRIGIGHPGDKELVTPWVLGNFPKSDNPLIEKLCDDIAIEIPKFFTSGLVGLRDSLVKLNSK